MADNPFRGLPQLQRLLEAPVARALAQRHGTGPLTDVLRAILSEVRGRIAAGTLAGAPEREELLGIAELRLAERGRLGLRRTINATGVILHTNLGRAPLAAEAIEAIAQVSSRYCNLEFDLGSGKRGSRTAALEPLLRDLVGAEAALAVNNGAAAILLALSALAQGGEVVVSRGELVEIGGGFRIPDVIRQGGAKLVEVGSTNRTRIEDYRAAIGPETRVLLKVHQSNFRISGFTGAANVAELAHLARERGLLMVADLGSGILAPAPGAAEASVSDVLAAGADLVTCSGDKLLGGPQAGLIVGRSIAVDPLRSHPLLRAVRLDKMSLAALEATLRLHRDRPDAVPVLRMMRQGEEELNTRAERLRDLVGHGTVEASDGFAGGGSLPEERIASRALTLAPACGLDQAAARLRHGDPAVIGRLAEGKLVLDVLTVSDEELPALAVALRALLA